MAIDKTAEKVDKAIDAISESFIVRDLNPSECCTAWRMVLEDAKNKLTLNCKCHVDLVEHRYLVDFIREARYQLQEALRKVNC